MEPTAAPAPELDLTAIAGGTFIMGDSSALAYRADGEQPRPVTVSAFSIGTAAVTNGEFAAFVAATGHVTDAQRYAWSFVFSGLLPDDFAPTRGVATAPWWRQVFGATWDHPEGPQSAVGDRNDHPVVHVSWSDAMAFATWAGARLASESEWEYAARAGATSTFPWGDELEAGGLHHANVWQGAFPSANTEADGWYGTAPVTAFAPNAWGLWNMIGNVWEWTADGFRRDHRGQPTTDPQGDPSARSKVQKGGSYLCHESYCHRYRPGARSGVALDSSAGNVGFRVATDNAPYDVARTDASPANWDHDESTARQSRR
jgi:sulfatase modifying factor 1